MKTSKKCNYLSKNRVFDGSNWSKLAVVLCCTLLFTITSCKPKDSAKSENTANQVEIDTNVDVELSKKPIFVKQDVAGGMSKAKLKKFKDSLVFEKGNSKPIAHEQYLEDEFKFTEVPNPEFDTEKSAVVGSHVCKFYPKAKLKTQDDLKNLPEGIEVPFATLLPIYGEPIKAPEYEDEKFYFTVDYFHFEDNYNWFYHTKWNGQEGLVFGADLTGLEFSTEKTELFLCNTLQKV